METTVPVNEVNFTKPKKTLSPNTRVKVADVPVGALVTCKYAVAALYSEYAGNTLVEFEPGMVGRVVSVDVPYVREQRKGEKRGDTFASVEFVKRGLPENPTFKLAPSESVWRVSLNYYNIVVLKEQE